MKESDVIKFVEVSPEASKQLDGELTRLWIALERADSNAIREWARKQIEKFHELMCTKVSIVTCSEPADERGEHE